MSVATYPSSNAAIPPQVLMRKWTVDEYHTMIQAGVFAPDDRFELLEGWIVAKMSRNPPHDVALDKAQDALRARVKPGWRVRIQSAITTADSETEPDIAVVPGPAERYLAAHPGPSDIALIVEIADSSLLIDRRNKCRIYARAGISLYWIINLVKRVVEVYMDPTGPTTNPSYRSRRDFGAAESVSLTIDGKNISVPVSDLLP